MSTKAEFRSFVESIVGKAVERAMRKLPFVRYATVQNALTAPVRANIYIGGNTSVLITDVRCLAPYTPVPGDTVLVLQQGDDRVILGKLGS